MINYLDSKTDGQTYKQKNKHTNRHMNKWKNRQKTDEQSNLMMDKFIKKLDEQKKRYSMYHISCKNQCKNYRNDLEWLGNQMQEIPSFEITVGVDGIN